MQMHINTSPTYYVAIESVQILMNKKRFRNEMFYGW